MINDVKAHALIRSLLWLLLSSLAGLAAAFLVPPAFARLTMIAAVLTGVVLSGLTYFLGTRRRARSTAATTISPQPAQPAKPMQSTGLPAPPASTGGTFLLLRIVKGTELSEPGLLSEAVAAQRSDWSWEEQLDSVAKGSTRWAATTHEGARADFVEIPVTLGNAAAVQTEVARVLQDLKLAGPTVRIREFLSSVVSGKVPFHLPQLRAVVVAVSHTHFRDDGDGAALEAVFRSIGQSTRAKYPTYIVITGLEEITGCGEALARLARERAALLAEPIGYFFGHGETEELRRATHTVVDAFGSWLPFLLDRENDSAESTLRLAESMRRPKIRSELSEKRQRLFELVARLEVIAEEITNRLQSLKVRWGSPRWGADLQGVFFSGIVSASTQPQEDVGYTYTRAHMVQRQRAFVAKFLTQELPAINGGSARVLGSSTRKWWLRSYVLATAVAIALILLIGVSAVVSWRQSSGF